MQVHQFIASVKEVVSYVFLVVVCLPALPRKNYQATFHRTCQRRVARAK